MPELITTRTADLGKPRIVTIGGGFDEPTQIVLFDIDNHYTLQPLFYPVATPASETSSIVFPFQKYFSDDLYHGMRDAKSINLTGNYSETLVGGVKYNYFVIINGVCANFTY